jgi:hypothetical protein
LPDSESTWKYKPLNNPYYPPVFEWTALENPRALQMNNDHNAPIFRVASYSLAADNRAAVHPRIRVCTLSSTFMKLI